MRFMVLAFALLFSCSGKEEELMDCSAEFVSSSIIELYDPVGEAITDAEISYTVDGVEGTYIKNMENGSYAIGGEEAGTFVVSIFTAIPFADDPCCNDVGEATLEYTIEANECHVIPQSFTPELAWGVVCTDADENGDCG